MSTGSTFTFSLTTIAAVAVIVACSPNNGKIGIGVQAPTAFQTAISACSDGMRSSEKVKPQAGTRTVEVCEFPLKADGTIADKPVPTTTDVSFSIQKGEDLKGRASGSDVHLAMMIGFAPNVVLDDKAKVDFRSKFAEDCQADTQAIFSRSKFGGSIQLHLSLNFQFDDAAVQLLSVDETETKTQTDHELRIEKHVEGNDTFWTLNQLPSLPKYYPHGKSADNQACATAGGSKKAQYQCALDHRKIVNLPVCAAFAKRVGNVLGIVDTAKENATCGAVQPAVVATPDAAPVTTESKPGPTAPQESSFAKPTGSDDDFMKRAELNKKDLVTILAPACPNLKDVK